MKCGLGWMKRASWLRKEVASGQPACRLMVEILARSTGMQPRSVYRLKC